MTTSAPNVFVTGVTGYIGGDALSQLIPVHPDWKYTFLVRDESRVASVIKQNPSVSIRLVTGDLDKTELLKKEAAAADIVIHYASSDHLPSIRAIIDGIGSSATAEKKKYLIHTSGTANLSHVDIENGTFGDATDKVWDDIADIDAINAWPETVMHRPVEKLVLEADKTYPHLKTAVVVPPAIVGEGRGPGNTRTIQVPIVIELSRKRGRAFQIGAGKAAWSFIHIHDLTDLYLRVIEAAAQGGGQADWGREGWYFVENGDLEWGAIGKHIAATMQEKGIIETSEVDSITPDEAQAIFPFLNLMAGSNAKARGPRGRKVLGWTPKVADFYPYINDLIDEDQKRPETRLDEFAKGHAPQF